MSDASTSQLQLPAPLVDINSITHPTESLPRPLRTLRRSFELLSVSYFVSIYGPAIGFPEFSLRDELFCGSQKLEEDLDGTQPDSYVPGLAARLLVLLTGDRCINANNWESRLRKEYSRRDPIGNPLGTEPLKMKPRHSKKAVGYVYIAEYIYDTPATAISQSVGVEAQNSLSTPIPTQPTSSKAVNGSSDKNTRLEVGSSMIESDEVTAVGSTTIKTITSEPMASAPIQLEEESRLDAVQTQTDADTSPVTQSVEQAPTVSADQLPQISSHNDSTPAELTSSVTQTLGNQDKQDGSLVAPKEISTTSNAVSTIDEPIQLVASGTNPDALPSHLTTREDDEPMHLAIPWSELSPLIKLRTLFKLCEWNFETAHDLDRFRRMIEGKATGFAGINALSSTSTDPVDSGDWRQERCGADSNSYSYWFTGQGIDATLWVQRPEPKPRTKITLRLSSNKGKARGKQTRASNSRSNKRSLDMAGPETAPGQTTDSNPRKGTSLSNNTPKSKRPRLSGTRTSSRLRKSSGADDWQTDPLELDSARSSHLNSPCTLPTSARPPTMIVIKNGALPTGKFKTLERIVTGTRASPRRRVGDDDEWQDVPEGWLDEVVMNTASQNTKLKAKAATQNQSSRSPKSASQSHTPLNSKLPPMSGAPASSVLSSELSDDLTSEDEAQPPIKKKLTSTEMTEADPQLKVGPDDAAHVDIASTKTDVADVPETIEVNGQQLKEPEVTVPELAQADSDVKMETEPMPIAHVRFELDTAMEESSTFAPPAAANGDQPPESESLPTEPVGVESDVKMDDGTIQNPHIKPSIDQTSDVTTVPIESVDLHSKDPDAVPTESLEGNSTPTVNCTEELAEERKEGDTTMLNPSTNPSHETEVQVKADEDENDPDQLKGHPLDPDWIGWEVVCSSLSEWQQFPRQFEGTQHPDEIALINFVTEEVLPILVKAHQEHENRLKLEEAMAQRKRSNRIATREVVQISAAEAAIAVSERETRLHSERLEARRLKEKQATEDRSQKEEDHRLVRLREREERIALREAQALMEREAEKKREERARLRAEAKVLGLAVKVARSGAENSVSPTDASESWELDCEICGVMGKNMDDGSEVICCDKCEKWQHLACHDNADQIRRLPKRDWSKADFVCSACSGIPIPRSVKHLRTHVNGKPKRPRNKKLKADGVEGGANDVTQAIRPKPRITLFVNDPDKRGEGSLSQVHPNKNLATPMASNISQQPSLSQIAQPLDNKPMNGHIAPALTNGFHQNPIFFKEELSPSISPHISPALTGVQPSPVPACTGLEPYYDDLDKLIPILRANVQLHRVLPVSVMHRVRRYLIDQQQRRQSTTVPNGSPSNSTHLTPTPNVFSIPPKPMLPLIAQFNPSLPVNIEPTQPLPPIGSALPTAADWYDQHHVKTSTTSFESFVDPIFASSIKLESRVESTIPKNEEKKVEEVDNEVVKPELQIIPPTSVDNHQSQSLSL
ncbi:uncharacterized protein MELLADRAFT_92342 [Melampsora larici-populina 98AG31]|uniref:PHD-type domain-containing protein n=1 Tax=Melampsora larici-populina (strain 98AG31 / pathotype 3-4-7) TaxID=747676 RepID=F4R997_MELLP|nr:uncharacterized protein MELLADRAFT_92342 [Melampsora larici-populina 98AG31]EGG10947.1 hypothetical protein MELLADRAFT_92342 [Melampsora larici-populina 98AG31]